jgi:FkbM family methyltransferase
MANLKLLPLKLLQTCARPFFGKGLGKLRPVQQTYGWLTRITTPRKKLITINGYRMEVNLRMGGIAHNLVYTHTYEPFTTSLFSEHAKTALHKCVIDIGANIGYYTLLAATLVGEKGRVYAFEPDKGNLAFLQHNVELNQLKNITISPNAVSDREGDTTIYLSNVEAGEHSLIKVPARKIDRTATIHTVTLDSVVNEPVGLIKVDVEGAEVKVLTGAKNLLQKYHPVLVVECWEDGLKASGNTIEGLFSLLKASGYDRIDMIDEHENKLVPARPELIREYFIKYNFSTNLLCLHNEAPN